MITGKAFYDVLAAVVPLYVAMILAYGSVRWWKIFTRDQCAGINRFVAVFAVPTLSFHLISKNDPYSMQFHFIAADTLQKVVILILIFLWQTFLGGSVDWAITLFSLSTLPNTLIVGVPLLKAMYGDFSASLMAQIVVLQSVVWYTILIILFEYRGAKALIAEQFPNSAASIASLRVESDVSSLSGREPVEVDAEIGDDGRLHVVLRRSSSRSPSITKTEGAFDLAGVEIYSVQSSTMSTFRFDGRDHQGKFASNMASPRQGYVENWKGDAYSMRSASISSTSDFEVKMGRGWKGTGGGRSMSSRLLDGDGDGGGWSLNDVVDDGLGSGGRKKYNRKEVGSSDGLHMFMWSSSASSPVSDGNLRHAALGRPASIDFEASNASMVLVPHDREIEVEDSLKIPRKSSTMDSPFLDQKTINTPQGGGKVNGAPPQMPPASIMTRLILIMVCRKLIRNPNTYASVLGVVWSLVSFRWKIKMPSIVDGSISIISNTGLGMAMFSLGLFMALQPKMIACGRSVAAFSMAARFLVGPASMAATSAAIGIRGLLLQVSIVQAALPEAIVPFVFAREYNCHADILSTSVIFGLVIAIPIVLIYYILLGL